MMYYVYILFIYAIVPLCAAKTNRGKNVCKEVPDETLEKILGPAFNSRYMSLDVPPTETSNTDSMKRRADYDEDFAVDDGYEGNFDRRAAWTVTNHVDETRKQYGGGRYKREDDNFGQEWHCQSKIHWTDLGQNYFPRYLRSVECLTQNCWYNIYKCRPRAFTVKILRRLPKKCVGVQVSYDLPRELRELWVWEEKAVTFCCDCAIYRGGLTDSTDS